MESIMRLVIFLTALLMPGLAHARDVALTSEVFVERQAVGADGNPVVRLEEPKVVTPGDPLVFRLKYHNAGAEPATGLVLTNPVPDAVAFIETGDAAAELSVDGGSTWGKLAMLMVAGADGTARPAAAEDVTHVRWSLAHAIAPGTGGTLSFRGKVK